MLHLPFEGWNIQRFIRIQNIHLCTIYDTFDCVPLSIEHGRVMEWSNLCKLPYFACSTHMLYTRSKSDMSKCDVLE